MILIAFMHIVCIIVAVSLDFFVYTHAPGDDPVDLHLLALCVAVCPLFFTSMLIFHHAGYLRGQLARSQWAMARYIKSGDVEALSRERIFTTPARDLSPAGLAMREALTTRLVELGISFPPADAT